MFQVYIHSGEEVTLVREVPPGYSLLEVALDADVPLHHNCGMVCSCSTCHIHITDGEVYVTAPTAREHEFLERANAPNTQSRLGCQCILLDGEGSITFTIPDQAPLGPY
ncbi:MAG: (2Fe-2S)-binding protein [Chitinophagia bacterium]|nr:(2Fe-2S)-binding protein [Chitinophagia bacterium]